MSLSPPACPTSTKDIFTRKDHNSRNILLAEGIRFSPNTGESLTVLVIGF